MEISTVLNMPNSTKTPLRGGVYLSAAELPSKKDRKRDKYKRPPQKIQNWKLTRTRHELLVDWSEMRDSSRQSTRAGLEKIMALCKTAGKDEFVIENIVPDYKVGSSDPMIVLDAQERIVSIFMQAATARFRELPEYRLSLRRGTFDLRFYLGRTRPTDCPGPDEVY